MLLKVHVSFSGNIDCILNNFVSINTIFLLNISWGGDGALWGLWFQKQCHWHLQNIERKNYIKYYRLKGQNQCTNVNNDNEDIFIIIFYKLVMAYFCHLL